jgi:hypothetical protein
MICARDRERETEKETDRERHSQRELSLLDRWMQALQLWEFSSSQLAC